MGGYLWGKHQKQNHTQQYPRDYVDMSNYCEKRDLNSVKKSR